MRYIYVLIDPNTHEVMYLGATNNPQRRYKQHCTNQYQSTPSLRRKWLDGLKANGQRPIMNIIDIYDGPDWRTKEFRALLWLEHRGFKLLNRQNRLHLVPIAA